MERSESPAAPGDTVAPRKNRKLAWLPRDDRELRTFAGFLLWFSPTLVMVISSFVPALCPENAEAWRYGLGIPAFAMAVAHITLFRRLSDRALQIALYVSGVLGVSIHIPLFFATPAIWGVNVSVLVPVIASGFFLVANAALLLTAYASLVTMMPVLVELDGSAPSDASRVFVMVPVVWAVGLALRAQRRGIDGALERVGKLAYHDPLTGLANRRKLGEEFDRHAATGSPLTLLLIDIDNFKSANTLYGHLGGDHALRSIGDALEAESAPGHLVARIGGDEFAVLIPGEAGERVRHLADGYRAAVIGAAKAMQLPGVELDASIGVAAKPVHGTTLDELLTVADESMYGEKAKHSRVSADPAPPPGERPQWLSAAPDADGDWHGQSAMQRWIRARPQFARVFGPATVVSALLLLAATRFDGAVVRDETQVLAVALAGVAAGVAIFLLRPAHGGWAHRAIDVLTVGGLASMMYLTGGSVSPALPVVYVLAVGQAWFWSVRSVAWRFLLPTALIVSPLLYDQAFREDGWEVAAATIYGLFAVTMTLVFSLTVANTSLMGIRRRQRRLALTDPLTGMPNRRAFSERIEREIDVSPPDNSLALVMIDMDNFKDVNTKLGHRAGDELLIEIGRALALVARSTDLVARVGGDEFAAVLPDAGVDGARLLSERFVAAVSIATESMAARSGIRVTASAGFALYPLHGSSLDELIQSADEALMAVKRGGKAGARVSDVVKAV